MWDIIWTLLVVFQLNSCRDFFIYIFASSIYYKDTQTHTEIGLVTLLCVRAHLHPPSPHAHSAPLHPPRLHLDVLLMGLQSNAVIFFPRDSEGYEYNSSISLKWRKKYLQYLFVVGGGV